MANQVMNFARGKIGYYAADALGLAGANTRLVVVVLEAVEADDTLNNYDELDALIAAAGSTIERGFVGVIVRGAPVGAEEDEPCEVLGQSHHTERSVDGQDLLFQGKTGPRQPFFVA